MYKVSDFFLAVDSIAPFATAESWDNVGLLIGGPDLPVTGALLAMDVTGPVLDEAATQGANLLITHHPVVFDPLRAVDSDSIVYRTIQAGISVLCAHTNLDLAAGGVNDALAAQLGLENIRPLERDSIGLTLGRIGELPRPMTPAILADYVKKRLGAAGVRYLDCRDSIATVAVSSGAGGSEMYRAKAAGADALIVGEGKHNLWLEAARIGLVLVDAGHFATEDPVLAPLGDKLRALLPGADISLSLACTDGIRFA